MYKKYNLQSAKMLFNEHNCELLATEYNNTSTPMPYICKCGNETTITLSDFKRGRRCRACGNQKAGVTRTGSGNPRWLTDRNSKRLNDKFRQKCISMLWKSLKIIGTLKCERTHKLLGYSYKQLREHIENHPDWPTVSNGKWDVDHIFPFKAFFDHGITDLKIINCLDNLRPLKRTDNIKKHAKYDKIAFRQWLESKGITMD